MRKLLISIRKTNIEKERNREKELTTEYEKDNNSLREQLGEKKGKLKENSLSAKERLFLL